MLELVAATAITAAVLVTSLELLRNSMELSRKIETNNAMTTFAVSKMEQKLANVAANFTESTESGDFTADGHPELNYFVQSSEDPADGGITDRLMSITATVWNDEDSDDFLDTGEAAVSFSTKISNMSVYQDAASNP